MVRIKKLICLVLAIVLCISLSMVETFNVQAATYNIYNVKGITWNIKAGRAFSYETYIDGVGFVKQKAKISAIKKKKCSKKGYTKFVFTVDTNRDVNFSDKQIENICNNNIIKSNGHENPGFYFVLLDKKTCKGAENTNLSVKRKVLSEKEYKTQSGIYSFKIEKVRIYATVICPTKNLKNMCIVFGGLSTEKSNYNLERKLFEGKIKITKTKPYFYTTRKNVLHGMKSIKLK